MIYNSKGIYATIFLRDFYARIRTLADLDPTGHLWPEHTFNAILLCTDEPGANQSVTEFALSRRIFLNSITKSDCLLFLPVYYPKYQLLAELVPTPSIYTIADALGISASKLPCIAFFAKPDVPEQASIIIELAKICPNLDVQDELANTLSMIFQATGKCRQRKRSLVPFFSKTNKKNTPIDCLKKSMGKMISREIQSQHASNKDKKILEVTSLAVDFVQLVTTIRSLLQQ